MKPIHLIMASLLATLPAAAQTGGDASARTDSAAASREAGVDVLLEQLGRQEATIDEQKATIEQLQQELDALRAGATAGQKQSEALAAARDSVQRLGRELSESRRRLKAQADSLAGLTQLQGAVKRLDTLLYKQCLLYPLERKYNERFVREALTTLDRLQIKERGLFQRDYDTYAPLLRDYKRYNDDVAALLRACAKRLDKLGYKTSPAMTETLQGLVESSPYYPLYRERNRPPYRSILYLDGVIDDLLAMLGGRAPLTREYYGRLMERVGLNPETTAP